MGFEKTRLLPRFTSWELLKFRKRILMLSSQKVPPLPFSSLGLFKTGLFTFQVFVELTLQRPSFDHLILNGLQSVIFCTESVLHSSNHSDRNLDCRTLSPGILSVLFALFPGACDHNSHRVCSGNSC